jgi:hypothetical protein
MNTKGKIVSLGHRPGSPENLRLIDECRNLANKYLAESIQELFQKNDDTLFGFAEKAGGEEANSRYFDAMRALRLKKEEIVRGFMAHMGRGFGRLLAPGDDDEPVHQAPVTLSLLDDAELEESLAIQSMGEKAENACAEELSPLRHRLGSLLGSAPLEGRDDPIGPARLAEGYRESLRVLDTDIEVRLVLYKLFDKVVLSTIEELYSDLNALLAKNGVMPEFKLRPRPERTRAARREAEKAQAQEAEASSAELLPLLRDLLTQQRGGGGSGAGGGGSGGGGAGGARVDDNAPPLDPREVMSALSSLQQQLKAIQIDGTGPVSADQVRAAMRNGGSISRQDSDVIDLISMLFESILDDRAVPDSVRILLARLQIPMLKVALVDRSFFNKPKHPARRLLNMLAKAGIGLDDSMGAENNPRLSEIERVVTSVLEGLTDDLGLFESLAEQFETFMARQTERELTAAKKQTISLRAREAKEQIRLAVHRKLDEFFAAQPVPGPVSELLRGPWTDVLVETRLMKDQTIWAVRTQLIRDLIISVTPKNTREERLGVPAVIARIVPGLRSGLGSIGYAPERIDNIVAMLEPYHLAVVHGKPVPSETAPPRPGIAADSVEALTAEVLARMAMASETPSPKPAAVEEPHVDGHDEEIVMATESLDFTGAAARAVAAQEDHAHDEYLQLARGYDVGSWFTFTQPDGRTKRAKLTWKSNLLDECIFLDWRMRMVADLNMAQFAGRLYDGTVAELHDTPLFDRAMDALMMRLKKQSA